MSLHIRFALAFLFFSLSQLAFPAYMPGDAWSGGILRYKLVENTGNTSLDLSAQAKTSFELAAQYYNNETQIRVVDVTLDLTIARGAYVEVRRQPSGRSYSNGHCGTFCGDPVIKLTDDASLETAIHEIFHTLSFAHEHQRQNRDQYVELSSDIPENLLSDFKIMDYPLYYELDFGNFDYDSIMMYESYMVRKASVEQTLEVMKEPVNFERSFRILLPDTTPNNSFDNLALNNESTGTGEFRVAGFKEGQLSAQFDIEYTGTGNRFYVKNIWQNKYLVANSSSIDLIEVNALESAGLAAEWEFLIAGQAFTIHNAASARFLQHNGADGVNVLAPIGGSAATQWLVKIRNTRDPNAHGLSLMDKVGLHQWYGYLFRFRLYDDTPENLDDNPAIHVEHGDFEVELGRLDKRWHSAMWALERVGSKWGPSRYVRIKNLWTQDYLHREFGEIDSAPAGTRHSGEVEISNWWSAQWDLVIKHDHFLVRNRWSGEYLYNNDGELTLGSEPDSSYKWLLQEVDWSE